MKVKITLFGMGGELNKVVINVKSETDPEISEAVTDMVSNGIHAGDTLKVEVVE